jgi:hypothetical protein
MVSTRSGCAASALPHAERRHLIRQDGCSSVKQSHVTAYNSPCHCSLQVYSLASRGPRRMHLSGHLNNCNLFSNQPSWLLEAGACQTGVGQAHQMAC